METSLIAGFSVFLLAAVLNGAFALPQKFVKNFAWENTWGSFYFFTMLIIPAIVIPLIVDHSVDIWKVAGSETIILTIVFGGLWGVGAVTFGYAISMVGLSLGFSIIMSINVAVGSLLPLIFQHPEELGTASGNVIILGIIGAVIGMILVGYAGILKERALTAKEQGQQQSDAPKRRMNLGLVIGIISGVMSACLNLGFSYAAQITEIAKEPQYGNPPWAAGLVSWMLLFWGGFATAGGFAIILLFKNRTWKKFRGPDVGRNLTLTFIQGILHFANVTCYGFGAYYIGDLGTSLGFAVFLSLSILVANLMGFITKEWKGVGRKPVTWILAAMAVLVISVCILGYGNSLREKTDQQTSRQIVTIDQTIT